MDKSGFHNKYLIEKFHFLVSWVGRMIECKRQKYRSHADVAPLRSAK